MILYLQAMISTFLCRFFPTHSSLLYGTLFCVCGLWSVTSGSYVIESDMYTPDPSRITCWTCPNKSSNNECNDWAPDLQCPVNHTVCQTVHRVNTLTGKSVLVNKLCALESECNENNIGCWDTETSNEKECISCCDYSYCNVEVPFNDSMALKLSSLGAASSNQISPSVLVFITATGHLIIVALTFLHGLG